MSVVVRNCFRGCCVWAILGTPGFAVDIELIPVGGVGNEITVSPGDRVSVEVRVSNWGDERLRGVQAGIRPESLRSASAGFLSLFEADVNEDGVCDAGTETYCTGCYNNTSPSFQMNGIYCDDCRADHFSRIPPGNPWTWAVDPSNLRMAYDAWPREGGLFDPGNGSYYVATFVLQTSDDAQGTFTIELADDGPGTTYAVTFESQAILPLNLTNAVIHIAEAAYGDVNRDEFVDLLDILCVLDGISGGFPICPFDAVNIEPCEKDTNVDLYDLVGVLDAFRGAERCSANR